MTRRGTITARQLKCLWTLAGMRGLGPDEVHDLLAVAGGPASTRSLNRAQAGRVIGMLRRGTVERIDRISRGQRRLIVALSQEIGLADLSALVARVSRGGTRDGNDLTTHQAWHLIAILRSMARRRTIQRPASCPAEGE